MLDLLRGWKPEDAIRATLKEVQEANASFYTTELITLLENACMQAVHTHTPQVDMYPKEFYIQFFTEYRDFLLNPETVELLQDFLNQYPHALAEHLNKVTAGSFEGAVLIIQTHYRQRN